MTKAVIDAVVEKKNKEFVLVGIKLRADLAEMDAALAENQGSCFGYGSAIGNRCYSGQVS